MQLQLGILKRNLGSGAADSSLVSQGVNFRDLPDVVVNKYNEIGLDTKVERKTLASGNPLAILHRVQGIALSVHGYCIECAGYLYCLHPFIIPLPSLQSAITIIQGMSTITQGISSSDASLEVEISSDMPVTKNVVKKKQDKPDKGSESNSELFLNQLGLNLTGIIIVMLGRMWDNDAYMLEFDGSKTIRKASVKKYGFVRYPFQLQDFDGIESSDNKYLIDVVGYMTNVERINHLKSCSRNLDFHLANHRVTLCGSLEDVLIEKKPNRLVCAQLFYLQPVPRSTTVNKFYLSSTSSTVIYDDDTIPAIKALKKRKQNSGTSVDLSQTRAETLEKLLMIRKGWNFPSCESNTYSLMDTVDEILPSEGIDGSVGSSNLDDYPDNQPQKMKRIVHDPSIVTPSKPVEERKKSRMDVEDSETKNSKDSANAKGKKGVVEPSAKKRKNYVFEALDKTLQDILGYKNQARRNCILGGMTVLLGEDFRQILPVIPNAKRPESWTALRGTISGHKFRRAKDLND
nr:replication protein A 70 kDa DNA-binding subunit C-like [Tanacetum cinerariifolium]